MKNTWLSASGSGAKAAAVRSGFLRYAAALGAVALGGGVREAFTPLWGPTQTPFLFFFPAVVFAAWYGRLGPAVLAIILSALTADWFFVEPRHSLSVEHPGQWTALLMFMAVAGFLAATIEKMHRIHGRLASSYAARQVAENHLAQEKELLATTLSSIGDAVIMTDALGRVTSLNPEAERLTGWVNSEVLGQPLTAVLRIVHGETREPAENPVEVVLRLGKASGLADHTVLLSRDGTERAIEDSAAPIQDSQGQRLGVVLVFRDISERRSAEQALRKNERELSDFFEHASVALHWVGPDGVILRANRAELSMLGYSPEEYIGRHIAEFHVDRPVIDDILAYLSRGETLREHPARLRCKDGSVRDVLISSNAWFEKGRFVHTRCFTRDITEQKRAEDALRESEARFRTMADGAPVLMWLSGTDRLCTWFNQRWLQFVGRGMEQELGNGWTANVHPDDLGRCVETYARAFEARQLFSMEYRMRRHDGAWRWLLDTGIPRYGPDQRFAGYIGSCVDLTEQKEIAEALRASQQRFQLALEAGRMGAWEWDIHTGKIIWSPGLEEIHGIAPHSFGGAVSDFQRDIHPGDLSLVLSAIQRALDQSQDYHITYRIQRPDGAVRWLEAFGRLTLGVDGKPHKLGGVCMDITERREAEQALRESEARLSRLIDSAMDAVITVDAAQRITLFNPAAEQMFGCPAAEALGSSLDRFIPPRFRQAHRGHVEKFGQTGVTSRRMGALTALTALRASGEEFPIEASISHMEVSGQKTFVVILRDITARQQAEIALRQAQTELAEHAATLEKTVAERTAKLRDTVHELQTLSYSMAHDMRAPLRAMGAFADLLLEGASGNGLSSEARDYCRRILTGASRLDRLIRDALSYNQAVLQELPLEPVNLFRLLHDLVETYPNLHAENADIRIEGDLPVVFGNESFLTQCFANLLGNAVKFVPPGKRPKVRVSAEVKGTLARIWIEDNGIGIARETQSRLFGMFQKLDNQYEGTGIGLAIVRKVVERMGGNVGAESELGCGSRFWVELPIATPKPGQKT